MNNGKLDKKKTSYSLQKYFYYFVGSLKVSTTLGTYLNIGFGLTYLVMIVTDNSNHCIYVLYSR